MAMFRRPRFRSFKRRRPLTRWTGIISNDSISSAIGADLNFTTNAILTRIVQRDDYVQTSVTQLEPAGPTCLRVVGDINWRIFPTIAGAYTGQVVFAIICADEDDLAASTLAYNPADPNNIVKRDWMHLYTEVWPFSVSGASPPVQTPVITHHFDVKVKRRLVNKSVAAYTTMATTGGGGANIFTFDQAILARGLLRGQF